ALRPLISDLQTPLAGPWKIRELFAESVGTDNRAQFRLTDRRRPGSRTGGEVEIDRRITGEHTGDVGNRGTGAWGEGDPDASFVAVRQAQLGRERRGRREDVASGEDLTVRLAGDDRDLMGLPDKAANCFAPKMTLQLGATTAGAVSEIEESFLQS